MPSTPFPPHIRAGGSFCMCPACFARSGDLAPFIPRHGYDARAMKTGSGGVACHTHFDTISTLGVAVPFPFPVCRGSLGRGGWTTSRGPGQACMPCLTGRRAGLPVGNNIRWICARVSLPAAAPLFFLRFAGRVRDGPALVRVLSLHIYRVRHPIIVCAMQPLCEDGRNWANGRVPGSRDLARHEVRLV